MDDYNVKQIGDFPSATDITDDDVLLAEQAGKTRKLSGKVLKDFCRAAISAFTTRAETAATKAEASKNAAAEIEQLIGEKAGVASFNGRSGLVVPQSGDYTAAMVDAYSKEQTDALLQRKVNPNLLDNWYFGNPVNQRGKATYENEMYTVDRWYIPGGGGTLDVQDGHVTILNSAWGFGQKVEYLPAGTYMFSALIRNLSAGSGLFTLSVNDIDAITIPVEEASGDDFTLICGQVTVPNITAAPVSFWNNSNYGTCSFDVKAVKLELGTEQTLAHQDENGKWVLNEISDYGEELRKCKRYQQYIGDALVQVMDANTVSVSPRYPVPMRANPNISLASGSIVVYDPAVGDCVFTITNFVEGPKTSDYVSFINLVGSFDKMPSVGTYKATTHNYLWADANL